jgi:hypothetical protein
LRWGALLPHAGLSVSTIDVARAFDVRPFLAHAHATAGDHDDCERAEPDPAHSQQT